ncbi:putative pentatricopeptide repeat-containing protein At3g15130 [Selaginella moellendorffii]|nr:putative pentatricopeptide repeat-containing protein At3g15130 [Selaginella moellendorffii]|eukprot:XP_024541982.1 putative pentatricopeptide repeat-containing protein At3g15130 [Selaginella moellendorffii]
MVGAALLLLLAGREAFRYCNLRLHSSGFKGARNAVESAQFSRVLRSSRISHAVLGSGEGFQELDEMLEKIATMPDPSQGYGFVLRQIGERKALAQGKRVHAHILRTRKWKSSAVVSNLLVQMYCQCGSVDLAREVFAGTIHRNEQSWSSMIAGYVHHGRHREALDLFLNLECEQRVQPNRSIFASALAACTHLGDLEHGRRIHERIHHSKIAGVHDVVIGNALVTMYARCGDLVSAREFFEGMREKNAMSWNAIISAYVQGGHPRKALELFARMTGKLNSFVFASAFTACSMVGEIDLGKKLYARFVESGLKPDLIVQNALMSMYAKCGDLDEARRTFLELPTRDVGAWACLMAGYAQHGDFARALELYNRMRDEKVEANAAIFSTLIAACSTLKEGFSGRNVWEARQDRGSETFFITFMAKTKTWLPGRASFRLTLGTG